MKEAENLVIAHKAYSEIEAISISSMLEAEGIESAIRSRQIPMYDGIARIFNPVWGYVLVFETDLDEAERLISEYCDGLPTDSEPGRGEE